MSKPQRPTLLSKYAEACLEALSASGHGRWLSLGGAFGLAHYFEYRATHDVDAWWLESATHEQRQQVVRLIEGALEKFGVVRTRSWGDVVSVELMEQGPAQSLPKGRVIFSFQIAQRSARLSAPLMSAWGGVPLDSFDDLVASKMAALVERGAPRDLRDIYMLCQSGQVSAAHCWKLWRARQQLTGENADPLRAEVAIRTHLARLAQARPLAQIADLQERAAAEQVRTWFATEFLRDMAN
ncbi:MAG: nucleotidyl transferase AbiEii/AbiGii toxin family protein [Chloroflexi bacterium]|nr:nucleotidyl transferase AbiEii/AbiGii toxin family protein [Chloroflexota bacterium]